MESPEKNNYTSFAFLKLADSSIFSDIATSFSIRNKQLGLKENLSVYIISILLLLILFKNALPKRKPKLGNISYADTLPYVRWIPWVKIPLFDGLIFWYKFRKDGVKMFEEFTAKLGPDLKLSIGFRTIIGISNPFTLQKLLGSTNLAHVNKPQFLYTQLFTKSMKDGLAVAKVDTWSHHRKVVTPAFNYKSLLTYCKFINDEAKALTESALSAAAEIQSNDECNNQKMRKLIDLHAVRIITHITMGTQKFNFSEEQRISFHENFERSRMLSVERFCRPELMIPAVWSLHPKSKELDQSLYKINIIVNHITNSYRMRNSVKEKSEKESTGLSPNPPSQNYHVNQSERKTDEEKLGIKPFQCLVELMIKAGLSNKENADEVATFLVTGHETIKVALDMLLFHLAGNQQYQKTCQTEVDELFRSKPSEDFDLEDFSKLKYLEMCILESMRLTPTVPFFLRELTEPLKIDDTSVIPAGEWIVVLVWALHRNPKIYPNPKKYDPNRFLPENVKQRHPYSFIPFSMGVRNCIGWKIALMEIKIIMSWILRHFEIHTTDGPNDVKLLFDITVKPERPYNVTFKQRLFHNSHSSN